MCNRPLRTAQACNRPEEAASGDGGFEYNPLNGDLADTNSTDGVEDRAHVLLKAGNTNVRRFPARAGLLFLEDCITPYIRALADVNDLETIRLAGVKIGVDLLRETSGGYREPLAELCKLNLTGLNRQVDPTQGSAGGRDRGENGKGSR